jgi:hypothetical protein
MEFVQFQGQTEILLNLFSYLGSSPHLRAAQSFGLRINLTEDVVLSISDGELSLHASAKPRFLQTRP